jgi:glycosyltransferase involved in cell wall biosynthesis
MTGKLTIGIPTYNGSEFIAETIESILVNLYPEIEKRVEILVSDNGSSDNTAEIVSGYVKKYPRLISYYRNDHNIGFDANVDAVFRRAKGEYVEVLGDDDFLEKGALKKIFWTLETQSDIAVILLSVSFLSHYNQLIGGQRYGKDELCEDGNAFFLKSKWGTSAISAIIIRKNDWLEQNLNKYHDTQWIHVAAIMEILKKNKRSYIISENMVTVRVGNPRWEINFGNQLLVGMEHLRLFSGLLDLGYDPNTFAFFLNDRFNKNLKDIVTLRGKQNKEMMLTAKLMIHFFHKKPIFWILHLPFLLLPYPLIKLIRSTVRKSRRVHEPVRAK